MNFFNANMNTRSMANKKIIFSGEFFTKVVQRQILETFSNMEECVREIERKMKEESVLIDSLNEKYPNQKWCLFELRKLGLIKVPFVETENEIIAITIAHPVTDMRCHEAFKKLSKKHI